MPGIAASELSLPLSGARPSCHPLAFLRRTLLYRHSMHSCSFPVVLPLSFYRYVPAGLAAMPMDYYGLCSRTPKAFARVHTCTCVRTCVRARSGIRERGDFYLSTGNKLTSCRKFASVPWEGSSRKWRLEEGTKARRASGERSKKEPLTRYVLKREFEKQHGKSFSFNVRISTREKGSSHQKKIEEETNTKIQK